MLDGLLGYKRATFRVFGIELTRFLIAFLLDRETVFPRIAVLNCVSPLGISSQKSGRQSGNRELPSHGV